MKEGPATEPPACDLKGKARRGPVERALGAFKGFFDESSFAEAYSRRRGFLQYVDPRFKLVGALFLVVCVVFVTQPVWILYAICFSIFLATASKVRLGRFLKRVWLFIPLFTAVVVLPSIFSFMVPGQPLVVLLSKGEAVGPLTSPWTVSLTAQGVSSAITFVLRTGAAVSLVVLIAVTTPWTDLLAAIQALKVPKAFVMVLGMTYRYVSLLAGIASEMHFALKSRTKVPGGRGSLARWLGAVAGILLRRSLMMSESVNLAMVSRGYDGRIRTMSRFKARAFDWVVLLLFFAVGILIFMLRGLAVI
jgi:cobalt/nickel transport system permease protein